MRLLYCHGVAKQSTLRQPGPTPRTVAIDVGGGGGIRVMGGQAGRAGLAARGGPTASAEEGRLRIALHSAVACSGAGVLSKAAPGAAAAPMRVKRERKSQHWPEHGTMVWMDEQSTQQLCSTRRRAWRDAG